MHDMGNQSPERFGDWVFFGPEKNVLTAPFLAQTTDPMPFELASGPVSVRRCGFRFRKWTGGPLEDDFGGKDLLEFEGEPLFAELIVLHLLRKEGWDAVWVDSYSRKFRHEWRRRSDPSVDLPVKPRMLFDRIADRKHGRGGCWDVFAWRRNEYLFAEAKGPHDRIRPSQRAWLDAALNMTDPLPLSSFVLVEWDFVQ